VLLVDDLLASPVNGLIWVFREIHKAATTEQATQRENIMAALSDLYLSLEQQEITEEEFDTQEQALLDQLDAYDARADAEDGQDEEDDDQDEEDDDEDEDEDNDKDDDDHPNSLSSPTTLAPAPDPAENPSSLGPASAVQGVPSKEKITS
jgi:TATA-binding protein-associated factor Taf7